MYRGGIILKSPEQIEEMARTGRVQARCLRMLRAKCRPGVTTKDLDEAAKRFITSQGATPSFLGYRGFPGSICASPNSMVVHGIPGPYRLQRGDIISIDVGVVLDGWVADAAITVPIGGISPVARRLLETTSAALYDAVEQCRPGNRLGDVGHAVEQTASAAGFSVVREYVGHGVGRSFHEDPHIPNYGPPGRREMLGAGMTLAIEPMVNAGKGATKTLDDGWTVVTADGSMSAHFEHTVAITLDGCEVLTRRAPR